MNRNNKKFHGLAVSPGIANGEIYIHRAEHIIHIPRISIKKKDIPNEMDRLKEAKFLVETELNAIRQKISTRYGENYAELVEAQIQILKDEEIDKQVYDYMSEHLLNVAYTYRIIINQYTDILSEGGSDFFQERILDIKDVKQKVLGILLSLNTNSEPEQYKANTILVTRYLTPADIIRQSDDNIIGIIAETGGTTSHAAILAKAMGIPILLGVKNATYDMNPGDHIILDGYHGLAISQPDYETEQHYKSELSRYENYELEFSKHRKDKSITKDGKTITLSANIGMPVEMEKVHKFSATGIGLYRSEYLYLMKTQLPTEEELFNEYKSVVEKMPNQPIILRTIDLGGDKLSGHFERIFREEANPFMGYRGIRISLDHPKLFITQLKAILRASIYGNIKIMFPMITVVEELRQSKVYVEEAKSILKKEGKAFADNVPLGILIEVPSAAMLSDILAKEVDFMSIGSNDLTQYLLAVDRGNEKVSELYCHFDPVVIRTMKWVLNSASKEDIPISICGEMAGDLKLTKLLIGLGFTNLSMSPISLDHIRSAVREIDSKDARTFANQILKLVSRQEINDCLESDFHKSYPDWEWD